jgi:hypothetical protein
LTFELWRKRQEIWLQSKEWYIYTLNIDNNCLFDSKIVINGKGWYQRTNRVVKRLSSVFSIKLHINRQSIFVNKLCFLYRKNKYIDIHIQSNGIPFGILDLRLLSTPLVSLIYGFWLPLWCLRFTASDYPFCILYLRLLITPFVS